MFLPLWPSLLWEGHQPFFWSQLFFPSCLQLPHSDSNFLECVAGSPCVQLPHLRHSDSSCDSSTPSPIATHPHLLITKAGSLRQRIWKKGSEGTEAIIVTTCAHHSRLTGIQVGSQQQCGLSPMRAAGFTASHLPTWIWVRGLLTPGCNTQPVFGGQNKAFLM